MRNPVRIAAAVLVGIGVGIAIGPSLGEFAVWSAVGVAALGVGLALGSMEPAGPAGPADPAPGHPADRTEAAEDRPPSALSDVTQPADHHRPEAGGPA